jgi:hypothetical protein
MDAARASRVNLFSNNVAAAGWEPLLVDLTPAPLPGEHHIVSSISAFGVFTANPIIVGALSALSGIYIINVNEPVESLADAQAGFNPNARGHRIAGIWHVEPVGALWVFNYVVTLGIPLILANGYTLRFIAVPNPGTATPGPGIGSTAAISAAVANEKNA